MHDQEAIQMMQRCAEEILRLRAERDALRPKADAYEQIAIVLSLLPRPGIGCGEDWVWLLNKRIAELVEKNKPVPPTNAVRDEAEAADQ